MSVPSVENTNLTTCTSNNSLALSRVKKGGQKRQFLARLAQKAMVLRYS